MPSGSSIPSANALQDGPATVPADLIALAQSGVGIAVASCDANGRPVLGLGVGCRINGQRLFRILLDRRANTQLIEAILGGSAVAATMTSARDHTSFQVKAPQARIAYARPDDLPELDRQQALLCEGLVELGYTAEQAASYAPYADADLVAVEFVPAKVFIQTPGPGAGKEIER